MSFKGVALPLSIVQTKEMKPLVGWKVLLANITIVAFMPSCVTNPEHVLRVLRHSLVNLLIQSKAPTTKKKQQKNPKQIAYWATDSIKMQCTILIYGFLKEMCLV